MCQKGDASWSVDDHVTTSSLTAPHVDGKIIRKVQKSYKIVTGFKQHLNEIMYKTH